MDKRDCFAFRQKDCRILLQKHCENCKFYKTQERIAKEEEKTEERIRNIYGVSVKNFLEIERKDSND